MSVDLSGWKRLIFVSCFGGELCREWIDLGVAATGGEGRRFLRSFRRLSVIWEGWTLSALPVSWR